jgi:DNA polymerase I-like protein with 3'-5' exonuclease and polymerase domains
MINIYPDLSGAKYICIDVETKDPDIKTTRLSAINKTGFIIGFSVGTDDGFKQYYPLRHPGEGNLPFDQTVDWLKKQMLNNVPKVGANILYDLEWLHFDLGVKVNGQKICIQATEALLDENKKSYSLDNLAREYLHETKVETALQEEADRLGIKHEEIKSNLWRMSAESVRAYGEGDADLPIRILLKQLPKISADELGKVYTLESKILDVLLEMRKTGVRVDEERARTLSIQLSEKEKLARHEILRTAGWDVDIWAGQDLQRAAEKLKLKYPLTDKMNPSFTSPWMNEQKDPFFTAVREARKMNRANETFVKSKLLESAYKGRLYPQYFSTRNDRYGTVTGRLSSANPNMQQIPARDEGIGPLIRSVFIPEDGQEWEVYDYSQQEPRVTVHYAFSCGLRGAEEAKRRYIEDPSTDYHQMVADMAGIERTPAKTINLGLAYGMGKAKMATQLKMSFEEVTKIYDKYHAAVPFVKLLGDKCTRIAEDRGYVKTIFGRRSHFEAWGSSNYGSGTLPLSREEAIEAYGPCVKRWFTYKAMNKIIQGSSADMIKQAMVEVWEKLHMAPIITVHDENDYSNNDREISKKIQDIMLNCVQLEVPLKVDFEHGPSWGECKKEKL